MNGFVRYGVLRLPVVAGLAAAFVISGAAPGFADPPAPGHDGVAPDAATIEELVDSIVPGQLSGDELPGAAVTVVADGEPLFSKGYGVAELDGTPFDPSGTTFHSASEAKLFTVAAALQLVEAGKLDLDTDVNEYLTGMTVDDSFAPITLRNLLTYTSGYDNDVYGWASWTPGEAPSLAELAADYQPDRIREPGKTVSYNNYDLVLAGRLVEIASGQSYADYVSAHVFQPLGMDSTSAAADQPSNLIDAMAGEFRPDGSGGQIRNVTGGVPPSEPSGGGTITTADDMAKFMIAVLANDSRIGKDVGAEMVAQQFTMDDRLPGMGYSFEQRPRNGYNIAFKDGDLPGSHHNLAVLPSAGIGVYVMYNGDGTDNAAFWDGKDLINRIVDSLPPGGDKLYGTDPAAAPADPDGTDVTRYAGDYASVRDPANNFGKLSSLTATVSVTAGDDGTLTTSGLSADPDADDQVWHQVGPGGVFADDSGRYTLAFTGDGVLVSSQDPSGAYRPLSWYESPMLNMAVLGLAVIVLLAGAVGYPVVALVRRRNPKPVAARIAGGFAWLTCAGVAMFIVTLALLMSDMNALNASMLTGDLTLALGLNTVSVVAVLTIVVAGFAVAGWIRGWWGRTGRIGYTVLAVAAIGFTLVCIQYRLIGVPFVLTV